MLKARDGGQNGESIPSRVPFPQEAADWFWAAVWDSRKETGFGVKWSWALSSPPLLSLTLTRTSQSTSLSLRWG